MVVCEIRRKNGNAYVIYTKHVLTGNRVLPLTSFDPPPCLWQIPTNIVASASVRRKYGL